jgi:hypothetical protein
LILSLRNAWNTRCIITVDFLDLGGEAMASLNQSLKNDLMILWKIQSDIQKTASMRGIEAAEGHLEELLDKVQEFTAKYGPEGFTISLGGVTGPGISFTWQSKRKPAPRFLAEV